MKKIYPAILIGLLIFLLSIFLYVIFVTFTTKNLFKVERYSENIYDLSGIKGWIYIDEENNEYSIQFYELGDYDYTCKDINELKNILITYYVQKYDFKTTEASAEVEKIFKSID